MSSLHHRLVRFLPSKHTSYELLSASSQQQVYWSSRLVSRRVFTLRNFLFTAFGLVTFVIFVNGGIPPLYTDIRLFERSLPQHNANFSVSAGIRYLAFPGHIWGHGWNNVLQE
jgi:hypothetical protein